MESEELEGKGKEREGVEYAGRRKRKVRERSGCREN